LSFYLKQLYKQSGFIEKDKAKNGVDIDDEMDELKRKSVFQIMNGEKRKGR
jgi:hypothetical protein